MGPQVYEDWANEDDRDDPFVGYVGIDRSEFRGVPEYDDPPPDAYDLQGL